MFSVTSELFKFENWPFLVHAKIKIYFQTSILTAPIWLQLYLVCVSNHVSGYTKDTFLTAFVQPAKKIGLKLKTSRPVFEVYPRQRILTRKAPRDYTT